MSYFWKIALSIVLSIVLIVFCEGVLLAPKKETHIEKVQLHEKLAQDLGRARRLENNKEELIVGTNKLSNAIAGLGRGFGQNDMDDFLANLDELVKRNDSQRRIKLNDELLVVEIMGPNQSVETILLELSGISALNVVKAFVKRDGDNLTIEMSLNMATNPNPNILFSDLVVKLEAQYPEFQSFQTRYSPPVTK